MHASGFVGRTAALIVPALIAFLHLAAGPAAAQVGTGSIVGQVSDESGGILPGVTVVAMRPPRARICESTRTGARVIPASSLFGSIISELGGPLRLRNFCRRAKNVPLRNLSG